MIGFKYVQNTIIIIIIIIIICTLLCKNVLVSSYLRGNNFFFITQLAVSYCSCWKSRFKKFVC